jgi:hypothetical protein
MHTSVASLSSAAPEIWLTHLDAKVSSKLQSNNGLLQSRDKNWKFLAKVFVTKAHAQLTEPEVHPQSDSGDHSRCRESTHHLQGEAQHGKLGKQDGQGHLE